jgi:hypothetical protein
MLTMAVLVLPIKVMTEEKHTAMHHLIAAAVVVELVQQEETLELAYLVMVAMVYLAILLEHL